MSSDLLAPEYRQRTLVFFALGGGGARTLEALLHLCALGLGPARLRVLIVDPDQANGSVGRALRALSQYREARAGLARMTHPEGFFRTEVELLAPDILVWSPLADDDYLPDTRFSAAVDRVLMKGDAPGLDTLFDLLYPARVREMDLSSGFQGVPSVGAVFMNRLTSEPMFAQLLAQAYADAGSFVFFAAGSLFGGTGAAALPAIASALRGDGRPRWRGADVRGARREALGAALLLPYFTVPRAAYGGEGRGHAGWLQNAEGVLPDYLGEDEPGYGAYYLLGDSLPRELERNEAGGSAQSNPAHYVELFAALAALDFAARAHPYEQRSPAYRIAGVGGEAPGWDDLPLTPGSRSALRSALVAMHVFLTVFRPDGRARSGLEAVLEGVTWAELLRLAPGEWAREAPVLDALGRFWAGTWEWLREMRRSTPALRLVDAGAGPPTAVPLFALVGSGDSHRRPRRDDVYAVFRYWNLEAAGRRGGGFRDLPAVMRLGTERFARDRFSAHAQEDGGGHGGENGRWLLPALGPGAGLRAPAAGAWSTLEAPARLRRALLHAGNDGKIDQGLHSPSPWARMLLFREAMREPTHPARALVENEILDALELLWGYDAHGLPLEVVRIRPDTLEDAAVSPRTAGFAEALVALAPRRGGRAALSSVAVARVGGRPVLGSSPYTLVFTVEDAAHESYPYLFRFARGERPRPLHDRPFGFQRYVAQVVLPQLLAPGTAGETGGDPAGPRLAEPGVAGFLSAEVEQARRVSARRAGELTPHDDWRRAADALGLQPLWIPFAGVELYVARSEQLRSRWMLRPTRGGGVPPLVLVPGSFDGVYSEGLPPVKLPATLEGLDRSILPVTGYRRRWVAPERDWLTDALLPLTCPLDSQHAVGGELYRAHPSVQDPPFVRAQVALPLTAEFFRWFRPEDVPRMLTLEVPRPGELVATLQVPVGSDDDEQEWLRVRRVYSQGEILAACVGPEVAVWPPFAVDDWHEYAVFRMDRVLGWGEQDGVLQMHAHAAGDRLEPLGHTQRTDVASTYAYGRAPEVLELRAAAESGLPTRPVGVILPRYRRAAPPGDGSWRVGLDVGAENTTVAVLRDGRREAELLASDGLVLPLTEVSADFSWFLGSYFLPERLAPEPLGSAVVYQVESRAYPRAVEPVALNLNILFSGCMRTNDRNRIATGLKLGTREADLLAAGFLRTIAMLALACAREQGVMPPNVTFSFAYGASFAPAQRYELHQRWEAALAAPDARDGGGAGEGATGRLAEGVDEAQAALRHFAHLGTLSPAGPPAAVFDVGATGTNLIAYAQGRVVALDSLYLAGRHLTGAPGTAHGRAGFGNPFVRAFAAWATSNGLPPSQVESLEACAAEGNDALAFRSLVHTRWFREGGAERFQLTAAHDSFRIVLFYFFGAFFYLAGLLSRAGRTDGGGEPLAAVVFAGNGSRFLRWLHRAWDAASRNPVRDALLHVLAAAAGEPAGPPPRVVVSADPKEEVARGLALPPGPPMSVPGDQPPGTLAGERLAVGGEGGATLEPTSSVTPRVYTDPWQIRWVGETTELERFHAALAEAARTLSQHGVEWTAAASRLNDVLTTMGRAQIQGATLARLETLQRDQGAFPGNVFAIEASGVVEKLMETLFEQ